MPLSTISGRDGLALISGHFIGMSLQAFLADLHDAGPTIGAQEEADYPGDKVMEFRAVPWILECLAFSACGDLVFEATAPDLAPGG